MTNISKDAIEGHIKCIMHDVEDADKTIDIIKAQAQRIYELEEYKRFADRVVMQVSCEDDVDVNDLLAAMLNGGLIEGEVYD